MTVQRGMILLPVWDFFQKRWVVVSKKGRVFDVEGEDIELFSLPVLASTIKKKDATVRAWERGGKFPQPMYRLPSTNQHAARRMYSKVQIANVRAVYRRTAAKIVKGTHYQEWARFFEDTWKVFFLLEMTPEARKGDVR